MYYTDDYEWIDFQGAVAYAGICSFKLTGFKQIQEVNFRDPSGFKKKGEVIATIKYNDYVVAAHMPVDGKILQVNEKLLTGNLNILLDFAESTGWMVLITPSKPHERNGLLLHKKYSMQIEKRKITR